MTFLQPGTGLVFITLILATVAWPHGVAPHAVTATRSLVRDEHRDDTPMPPTPPSPKKVPYTVVFHGETLEDPYFWMRDRDDPDTLEHLRAENAYLDAVAQPTIQPLADRLYQEMLGRIQQTDLSVPARKGTYAYYNRTEEGKQYPLVCRRPVNPNGEVAETPEDILLDLNQLAQGKPYLALGTLEVSPNAQLLAYSIDETGYRVYTLRIKNLRTGELLPDTLEKVTGVAWSSDNRFLFYTVEDAAKRSFRLYRHVVGQADSSQDVLIDEEPDPLYDLEIETTLDDRYLLATHSSFETTEIKTLRLDQPERQLATILPKVEGRRYSVAHRDGLWFIVTDQDAPNFKLVVAPVDRAEPSNWVEVIPACDEQTVESVEVFKNHAVVRLTRDALPHLLVIDLSEVQATSPHLDPSTWPRHEITFPEPVYSTYPGDNREYDTTTFRLTYSSFITPTSIYDYDLVSRERVLRKQTPVLGGYDPNQYVSERIEATSHDGVMIPISLVRRKETPRDGSAPCLLYGYGSYGASIPVAFDSNRLSLLDRGFVYALAHIRGGGDKGESWYADGKMAKKMNTFLDFVACADRLVERGDCARDRLAIEGGSAGGLLVGATLNLRPDLCRAAILSVPFVDVLNTMSDESLPLTTGEFLEWGNPKIKEQYDWMRRYCPYTNIKHADYPAILVEISLNDSQVPYWEGAKYAARLRERRLKTDTDPVLVKVNLDAGHGGASGRYDSLKEEAFRYAFLLNTLNAADFQ